ncbi:MAG: LysM peptidoglycan-binding domain-containing protein [Chitinophagales bacterium]|nr:LysM peptidoglycan-binding domain-containing protein [Chitinophagales bacterium]
MLRLLITGLLIVSSYFSFAGQADSLFVIAKGEKWVIGHTVKRGETIFSIARLYHVPPAKLADENGLNYQSGLPVGVQLYVPLESYNKANATTPQSGWKPVHYRVRQGDNLYRISKTINEQQRVLQDWNGLPDNSVEVGQALVVARVMYDEQSANFNGSSVGNVSGKTTTQQQAPAPKQEEKKAEKITSSTTGTAANGQKYTLEMKEKQERQSDGSMATVYVRDTVWNDTLGMYGKIYMQQTAGERYVIEEKGSAVFFETPNKVKSRYGNDAKNTLIYAFHNLAKRGTIIKVYNPGTDKYVFVKVMGPLPETKQYYNSLIGIGDDAKEILGIMEDKAWVELKYNSK